MYFSVVFAHSGCLWSGQRTLISELHWTPLSCIQTCYPDSLREQIWITERGIQWNSGINALMPGKEGRWVWSLLKEAFIHLEARGLNPGSCTNFCSWITNIPRYFLLFMDGQITIQFKIRAKVQQSLYSLYIKIYFWTKEN